MAPDGSGPERRFPATVWSLIFTTRRVLPQESPPSVDRNERIDDSDASAIGTTTVPFGWTSGCPPSPVPLFAVFFAAPHVRPPSDDVTILIRLPSPKSSNCA